MKKLFFLSTVALLSSLHGEESSSEKRGSFETIVKNSMGYVELGLGPAPLPLPIFGIGYRMQSGHHGADFSLQSTPLVIVNQVKANALYHYYFTPNLKSQFYFGLGAGTGCIIWEEHGRHWKARTFLSPEFAFGKQYINDTGGKRFFQTQLSFPTFAFNHFPDKPIYFPLIVFTYGIGF